MLFHKIIYATDHRNRYKDTEFSLPKASLQSHHHFIYSMLSKSIYSDFNQVRAKMGKSTQTVFWGRSVKTCRTKGPVPQDNEHE